MMQALLDAIVNFVALVSPAKARLVAGVLREATLSDAARAVHPLLGTPAARAAAGRVLAEWAQHRTSGNEVAGMLLGASEACQRMDREQIIELVWTGPTTRFVPIRRTEQVLIDLIANAHTDLFLVSFVAYDVASVTNALNQAATRGVRLRLLLEASTSQGGSLAFDPASNMRTNVPAAEILTWKEKSEPFVDGKVHAKLAVIDASRAFITSANLTGHALDKNIEAGVLINGGPVPKTLSDHLQALIDVGVLGRA